MRFVVGLVVATLVVACAPNLAEIKRDEFTRNAAGCDKGDAQSCVSAGDNAQLGSGTKKDLRRAAQFFRKACVKGGAQRGCLGLVGLSASAAKEDPGLARQALLDSCAAGYLHACEQLALDYELGQLGFQKDPARARELHAQTCLAAERATEEAPTDDLSAMATACSQLAGELSQEKAMDARLGAVKLSIVSAELRMEASEVSWLGQDRSALASKQQLEAIQEMNRRLADEEAARQSRWAAILDGLQAGLESVQPLIQQQQQLAQMNAKVVADARAYQAQQHAHRYTPPPRPARIGGGAGTSGQTAQVLNQQTQAIPNQLAQQQEAARQHRAQQLNQCLAEKVSARRVTKTNPFPSLASQYDRVRYNATQLCGPPQNFKKCMSANAILWPDSQAAPAWEDYSRRVGALSPFANPKPEYCTEAVTLKEVRSQCLWVGTQSNCVGLLDNAIKEMTCADANFSKLVAAEEAADDAGAQTKHDDECRRRFPQ